MNTGLTNNMKTSMSQESSEPTTNSEKRRKLDTLSPNDQKVLNLIFNNTTAEAAPKTIIDLTLPPDQHVETSKVEKLVELEKRAIRLELEGRIHEALELLNAIIEEEPLYASAYNNRAQILRIANPDLATLPPGVTADLESAVALAQPTSQRSSVSKMQAQVLRNSYGQLASIYLLQSKRPENSDQSWQLQLRASDLMVQASKYGEQIAASLAIAVNPYARLCGNMVEAVLGNYR